MNEAAFNRSIKKAHGLFNELGLLRAIQVPHSLPVSHAFNEVALDVERPYEEVYFSGLRLNHLNFILQDLTFFHFSRDSETEARYAFYPSPFSEGARALLSSFLKLRDDGLIEDEPFMHAIESLPINCCRPVLRYEYSDSQYRRVRHPISHLHIGTYGQDRWSFEKFLTPFAFSLQVAKMYFGPHWEALTVEEADNRENQFDSYLVSEKASCAMAPVERFCEVERQHFYMK